MSGRATNAVRVAGGAVGRFARYSDLSLAQIAAPVVRTALRVTGVEPADIQAAFVGNAFGGALTDQESILAQILLAPAGITGVPMRTIKNACSSGSDAVHLAWSAIAHGQYECVLVLGAEKLTHPDKARALAALSTATDQAPAGERRSVFIDINALRARRYMERYGAQPLHFAQVAVKNRRHGSLNERAAQRTLLSVDEVLAEPALVAPLTRSMCGGIVDGAACVVLASQSFARRHCAGPTSRVVASTCASGVPAGRPGSSATQRAALAAYELGSIEPSDVQVVEVHDPTAPQELFDIEDLMLCGRGEAIRLTEAGDTSLGGRMPVNTSGGLTSRGHPLGATGVAQIIELHEQLTGSAGARQVEGARIALAQMAGGLLGEDSAVATVHLLTT